MMWLTDDSVLEWRRVLTRRGLDDDGGCEGMKGYAVGKAASTSVASHILVFGLIDPSTSNASLEVIFECFVLWKWCCRCLEEICDGWMFWSILMLTEVRHTAQNFEKTWALARAKAVSQS